MTGETLYTELANNWHKLAVLDDFLDAKVNWLKLPTDQAAVFKAVCGTHAIMTYEYLRKQLIAFNLPVVGIRAIPWASQDSTRQQAFEATALFLNGLIASAGLTSVNGHAPATVTSTAAIKELLNSIGQDARQEIYNWLHSAHNCRIY